MKGEGCERETWSLHNTLGSIYLHFEGVGVGAAGNLSLPSQDVGPMPIKTACRVLLGECPRLPKLESPCLVWSDVSLQLRRCVDFTGRAKRAFGIPPFQFTKDFKMQLKRKHLFCSQHMHDMDGSIQSFRVGEINDVFGKAWQLCMSSRQR